MKKYSKIFFVQKYLRVKKSEGFTLIELLVVLSIIMFVASIAFASINTARTRTRDARRRADLKQIVVALEIYQNDFGKFPSTGGEWRGICTAYNNGGTYIETGENGWISGLAPIYMPVLPSDPSPREPTGCYIYNSDDEGRDYKIVAYGTVETLIPVPVTDPMYDPLNENSFALYTPDAAGW